MSKTATAATLSPLVMSTGNGIYKQHIQSVIEMCNYAAGGNQDAICIVETGVSGALATWSHAAYFPASSTTMYVINLWIDPDLQSVRIKTVATMAASHTGDVVLTVGGWSATHSHTAGATTQLTSTPTTAASPTGVGTGWQTITVALQRTSGSTKTSARLDCIIVEGQAIAAASLPGPANE